MNLLAGAHLPKPQQPVPAVHREEPPAVPADGHGPEDRLLIPEPVAPGFLAGAEVPEPKHFVLTTGKGLLAVGQEEAVGRPAFMPGELPHLLTCRDLPEPERSVAVTREDLLPIRREGAVAVQRPH